MSKQVNMLWSDATMSKADELMTVIRKSTGANVTRTQLVESMIDQAHAQIKRIEPIKDGNRTIGWRAGYGDHLVIETDGAGSKPQAQKALDAFVFEELSK